MAAQTNVRVGGSSAKSRQFKYDFVRFVAMTWVIGVHALTVVDTGRRLGSWYVVLCQAVFFTANAIFFMLSGKFNLVRKNSEDWRGFYVRKARGILLPVLVLFFIRTAYDMWPDLGTPLHFLKTFALNTVDYFDCREYWFVFQLLSMLVVTPFLVPVVESLDQGKKKLLMVLGLLWFTASFFMTNLGYELGYSSCSVVSGLHTSSGRLSRDFSRMHCISVSSCLLESWLLLRPLWRFSVGILPAPSTLLRSI